MYNLWKLDIHIKIISKMEIGTYHTVKPEENSQTWRTGVSTSTKPKDSTVFRISETIY